MPWRLPLGNWTSSRLAGGHGAPAPGLAADSAATFLALCSHDSCRYLQELQGTSAYLLDSLDKPAWFSGMKIAGANAGMA